MPDGYRVWDGGMRIPTCMCLLKRLDETYEEYHQMLQDAWL